MATLPSIRISGLGKPSEAVAVIFAEKENKLSDQAVDMVGGDAAFIERAAKISEFEGKKSSFLDVIAPEDSAVDRVIVVGLGDAAELEESDWRNLGGELVGKLKSLKIEKAELRFDAPDASAETLAAFAQGGFLRGYVFDAYKTTKKEEENNADWALSLTIQCGFEAEAAAAWKEAEAVAGGVLLARELVDLPPNALGPVEFAQKAVDLGALGVETEVLDVEQMEKLGMHALLGVGQGSRRPSRLAIMKWNGGKDGDTPIAFVGKGVVFDTGGISLKPGAGMEDMKGDMGGAAAVIGLMHALAARKAPVNVIGVLGLVENMPDGNAQRPGDIVTSMSGQTIEILNTDAEGRLVLADAIWYTQDRFKPSFIIDLATLTGACLVALGTHRAGLFSNDDELAERIHKAGEFTDEKVWRLPLGKEYDKMIDTPNADMRNTGGSRFAGATTAAQFLQRFTNETTWAHLDVAGTAMGSNKNAISQGWASGFGVRLLDKLVKDHYENS
ncbi:leucyl aminopeptidase [Pseudovibrio sp. SPO723]|uniref:leucyl aminopeptidase n=1 Tax=Nesiotobacter zosterae TaxID=392721 RepID=UPI0029C40BF3|nr:leucyl aminopeptidase [Pseudovibrio sp. SPO723]MDX5593778.1 leucyl aminopeptidase [Pseudovibrio sp. SPO723]